MAHINLLPWREERRQEQQRQFGVMAGGAAVLAGLIVWYMHIFVAGMIDNQDQRNDFIQKEIVAVEAKIKEIGELTQTRKNLIARMRVIEQLQSSRPIAVHLFEEIAKTIPEGVSLTTLKHDGDAIKLSGEAQSNARVSIYMRNLDDSQWLTNPVLKIIRTQGEDLDRKFVFDLTVTQTTPQEPGEEGRSQ